MLYFALGLVVGWGVTAVIGIHVFLNEVVNEAYEQDLVRRYNHE